MPKKKQTNGASKKANRSTKKTNGVSKKVEAAPPVSPAPEPPSYRELKSELGAEVTEFRDYLVTKYSNYHGHDMRKDAAWYLEQYGQGILSEIERQKRLERDKIIAANRIQELEKQLTDETMTAQHRESIEEQLKQFKALLSRPQ